MTKAELEQKVKELEDEKMFLRYQYYCVRNAGIKIQEFLEKVSVLIPSEKKTQSFKNKYTRCVTYNFYSGKNDRKITKKYQEELSPKK